MKSQAEIAAEAEGRLFNIYACDPQTGLPTEKVGSVAAENAPHALKLAWEKWPELKPSAEFPPGRAIARNAERDDLTG